MFAATFFFYYKCRCQTSTSTRLRFSTGQCRPVEKLSLVDGQPGTLTVDAVDNVDVHFY